jgi:hypothetical protein
VSRYVGRRARSHAGVRAAVSSDKPWWKREIKKGISRCQPSVSQPATDLPVGLQ